MDRSEMYMVETYKREELRKKLKPIKNWEKVLGGARLFHDTDNNITNNSIFISYDKANNLVNYMVVDYSQSENKDYTMSASGWYYYDESIADEVAEHYTPKLYIINDVDCKEDYWFVVAFDEQHLKKEFIKAMNMENMSDEDFWEKYWYEILKNVDEFEIVLR